MSDSYLPYIQFSIFMGNLGFFSNAFFGFILVFATLFFIKKQFGSYKYLLVNFQILGFIFATFEYLFHTFLHTYDASLLYFSLSRPAGLSNLTMEWMMAIYTGLYSATIAQLAIQFIYRYWAIFDTRKLRFFNGWKYILWMLYYIFFGCLWAFAVGHFFAMDDFGRNYYADEILLRYEENITDVPVLALIAYENGHIRWRNITAPTIILFCPVFFMIYIPFADLKMSFPSCIIQSGFTVYPAMDSLIMMICVSEYEKVFKKVLISVKHKIMNTTPVRRDTPTASRAVTTNQSSRL